MKAKITVMAAIAALLLAVVGYAQEPRATPRAIVKRGAQGAIEVGAITATWKVTAVDTSKRTVTLSNEAGVTNTYEIGDAVRNFDQIKVGDEVKATLLESVAVAIRKSSAAPDAGERDTVGRAQGRNAGRDHGENEANHWEDSFRGHNGPDGDHRRSERWDTDNQGGTGSQTGSVPEGR